MDVEKDIDGVNSALLGGDEINSPERYPTSQFRQFWVVLKRTLLFSRRDWVNNCDCEIYPMSSFILIPILYSTITDSDVSSFIRTHFGRFPNWSSLLRYW